MTTELRKILFHSVGVFFLSIVCLAYTLIPTFANTKDTDQLSSQEIFASFIKYYYDVITIDEIKDFVKLNQIQISINEFTDYLKQYGELDKDGKISFNSDISLSGHFELAQQNTLIYMNERNEPNLFFSLQIDENTHTPILTPIEYTTVKIIGDPFSYYISNSDIVLFETENEYFLKKCSSLLLKSNLGYEITEISVNGLSQKNDSLESFSISLNSDSDSQTVEISSRFTPQYSQENQTLILKDGRKAYQVTFDLDVGINFPVPIANETFLIVTKINDDLKYFALENQETKFSFEIEDNYLLDTCFLINHDSKKSINVSPISICINKPIEIAINSQEKISFNQTEINMQVGELKQLTLLSGIKENHTIETSDSTVLKGCEYENNYVFTALKEGTYTITARQNNYHTECKINVEKGQSNEKLNLKIEDINILYENNWLAQEAIEILNKQVDNPILDESNNQLWYTTNLINASLSNNDFLSLEKIKSYLHENSLTATYLNPQIMIYVNSTPLFSTTTISTPKSFIIEIPNEYKDIKLIQIKDNEIINIESQRISDNAIAFTLNHLGLIALTYQNTTTDDTTENDFKFELETDVKTNYIYYGYFTKDNCINNVDLNAHGFKYAKKDNQALFPTEYYDALTNEPIYFATHSSNNWSSYRDYLLEVGIWSTPVIVK